MIKYYFRVNDKLVFLFVYDNFKQAKVVVNGVQRTPLYFTKDGNTELVTVNQGDKTLTTNNWMFCN